MQWHLDKRRKQDRFHHEQRCWCLRYLVRELNFQGYQKWWSQPLNLWTYPTSLQLRHLWSKKRKRKNVIHSEFLRWTLNVRVESSYSDKRCSSVHKKELLILKDNDLKRNLRDDVVFQFKLLKFIVLMEEL